MHLSTQPLPPVRQQHRALVLACVVILVSTLGACFLISLEKPVRNIGPDDPRASAIATSDRDYLLSLCRDTWSYLEQHVDERTEFPTDSQRPGGTTNTTNIGLYLACIGIATEMGIEPREKALARVRQILDSLQKLESRHGFFNNWVSVEGSTKMTPGVNAVSDFNKTVAGLIIVRQLFPEVKTQASALIDRVEWSWVYNKDKGLAYYGYDLVADKPVGETRLWFAADVRLAGFMLVASGAAPPEFWESMERREIHSGELSFFWPGYKMGGLFMQAMDGIFLEEHGTEMGRSVGNFAWHQIQFAQSRRLPVWGWSNCNVPGAGYTEGGYLPWWVVTPHASALAIEYYPRHVIANLHELEKLGLRQPLPGTNSSYGFRDAINLRTKVLDDRYLCLDQAMLFLSLANYLENGIVRRTFAQDPLVGHGLAALQTQRRSDPALLSEWARRDALPTPELKPSDSEIPLRDDVVINFRDGSAAVEISTATFKPNNSVQATRTDKGLVIDFDLGAEGEAEIRLAIPPLDARVLREIIIVASGVCRNNVKQPFGLRMDLSDSQDQRQYAYISDLTEKVTSHRIGDQSLPGIFARPEAVTTLQFKLWSKPWFFSDQNTRVNEGQILIEKIIFRFALH